MSVVHLYGETKDGAWKPWRVNDNGESVQATSPTWNYAAASGGITDTADVTLKDAAANKVNYISTFSFLNKSATATEIVIKDGSTVIARHMAPASMITTTTIPYNGTLYSSVNTALNAACITNSTATYINVTGYQEASSEIVQAAFTEGLEELFDALGNLITTDAGETIYI